MRRSTIGVFLGVVVLMALLGYGLVRLSSAAPASPSEPIALRSGKQASDFSIKLFSGDGFRLSDQRGKVVVVNFWASWCPPCREEAPVLERAWQAYKDKGVVFVGVDVWDTEKDALSFIKEFGITYSNGPDPNGEIAIDYGLTGVPETWFIDREGRLVRRWTGALTDEQITAFIEEARR